MDILDGMGDMERCLRQQPDPHPVAHVHCAVTVVQRRHMSWRSLCYGHKA